MNGRMLLLTACLALLLSPLLHGDEGLDAWATLVAEAEREHGAAGRRAAEFLVAHRPARDGALDVGLVRENLELALRAREEFPWAASVPEELFLNDVLPYAVLDETRERWRPWLFGLGRVLVRDCTTAAEAAQALNRGLFDRVGVHYDTGRKKPNQSPAESIAQGRATCTGLSILLVDACRAVGIPARIAGVASWNGKDGNHTWVEIWDGRWHFAGADEPDAQGLDRAWFVGDAARAVPGDPVHAVWATSWRRTGHHFRMAWSPDDDAVPGVDVTHRYRRGGDDEEAKHAVRHVRAWGAGADERIVVTVRAIDPVGTEVAEVTTRAGRADLNDMPRIVLDPGVRYRLEVRRGEEVRWTAVESPSPGVETIELRWGELQTAGREG